MAQNLEIHGGVRRVRWCALDAFSPTAICFLMVMLLAGCQDRPASKIVFQSTRDGNFEIYAMNADGSDQRRLTHSPSNDVNPSWSPDGTTIVFASDRDNNWEIYTMRSDGSDQRRLTHDHGTCTAPSWNRDGSKILFVSTSDSPNGNLYLMDPDGSQITQVTSDSLVKDSPVLSPDGRTIIVTVNQKGRYRIASYRIAEKSWHFLTPEESNNLHPALSSDGSKILFTSDRNGNFEIYVMDNLGLDLTQLTTNAVSDILPCWTDVPGEILLTRGGSIYRRRLNDGKETLLAFKGDSAPNTRVP